MTSPKTIHSRQYNLFLRRLRDARKQAGLSQEQLAERTGRTQSFISKCERGERRIDVIELLEFCRALRINFRRFVDQIEEGFHGPGR